MSINISSQLARWLEIHREHEKELGEGGPIPPVDGASNGNGTSNGHSTKQSLPVEIVTLRVTEQEIYWAVQSGLKKPILIALQRTTGTLWRLFDSGAAIEVMVPHRACILPSDALFEVDETTMGQEWINAEWEVPLFPTHQQKGYSLIQRHHIPDGMVEASRTHYDGSQKN